MEAPWGFLTARDLGANISRALKSVYMQNKYGGSIRSHDSLTPGGVRTLIALHHGRKTKSELLASCRGRVDISSGGEIA